MLSGKSSAALGASLVFAVALWGGNNAGTKWLVQSWPPVFTGGTRFLCAGLLLLAVIRWTKWFGAFHPLGLEARRRLWWRGGLSLALYIIAFNSALLFTSASHVALHLGAAPVWALLWEDIQQRKVRALKNYLAALLALSGVLVLLLPALKNSGGSLPGELLGFASSLLWVNHGRQSRALMATLGSLEITAHSMWRAGVLLLPAGFIELGVRGITFQPFQFGVQAYCILAGGVAAFALWNNALRFWPTSQALLFNNLIPVSTMTWAHYCLGEPFTRTFWMAMILIIAGVLLGQSDFFRQPAATPR